GFAAALAVLIIEASQSRKHGKSKPLSYYLLDEVVNSCSAFLCPDTLVRLPMDIRLKINLGKSVGSRKSPTKSLFDVGSSRISIFTVTT
ncbi:hypothetical protein Tco_0113820, partial [Tanacetum coccineum]